MSKDRFSLFLNGGLEGKFAEVKKVKKKIDRITSRGVRESGELDKLIERRKNLTIDINNHMINGERLEDDLMDYCFRNFSGGDYNVFPFVPLVKEFLEAVNSINGEKILSTYGSETAHLGIIAGQSYFKIEDSFRHLYVPVKDAKTLTSKGWEKYKVWNKKDDRHIDSDRLSIIGDIFLNGSRFIYTLVGSKKTEWRTDYSGQTYIGGKGPEESVIYLGNKAVNDRLGRGFEIKIPEQTVRIKSELSVSERMN